jgi:multisubunit Na+/H+ antiporter MnhB subunit
MMKLEPGILYTAIALVFFYLYLAWLRGRKRRLARETALAMSKAHGAKKRELAAMLPDPNAPRYQIRSWILVVVMMALLCLALLVRNGSLLTEYKDYWWIASVVGVVGFAFCLK